MIDENEMKLLNWKSVEIPSKEIGKMVMEKLKDIDPVAYIRFATIYLDIKDVNEFRKIIEDFSIKNYKKLE